LPVSVILGGPPSLIIAAIAPLPEGLDERLIAAYLSGRPLDMIQRPGSGHRIPVSAEFVLEGEVRPGDTRTEGPFGDHFGHYSHAAPYPVFHVKRILSRKDAIYPATVVGKPIQEDYYIGEALQEIAIPLLRIMKPAIADLWAYPQTGFHALAVMAVHQRYPHEALKSVMGMLGEGQVSLTKIMIAVDPGVDVRDFESVSKALWRYLSRDGIHLISPTALDTLDFTGPAMSTGSRLILMATKGDRGPLRTDPPAPPPNSGDLHPMILDLMAVGPAVLMIRVDDRLTDIETVAQALRQHTGTKDYLFHVLVSSDISLEDPVLRLWGWFTRFDPQKDIHPAARSVHGNRLLLEFPILIDARWKNGYPKPVAFDPEVAHRVDRRWSEYGIRLD
jgi:3-polyprenyl-4-hydroxybenzoate decarboxylase